MKPRTKPDVLVLSMAPYRYATRTRKAADRYSTVRETLFLSPRGVGRTGKWDEPGTTRRGNLTVQQIPSRMIRQRGGRMSALFNIALCYLPTYLRLLVVVLTTPSRVVHVTGAPLAPLAFAHRQRFRSTLVLDINERPASVGARESAFSLIAKLEPFVLRVGAQLSQVTTVVAPGHAEILEQYGYKEVVIVPNGPDERWRVPYRTPGPKDGGLNIVTIGSIFENRAFEPMIEAIALSRSNGVTASLSIYGPGRSEYIASLVALAQSHGVADHVTFNGAIDRDSVAETYQTGHIGLAIYDPADPGNDSLSNKILEVVSSGRPVLAGDLSQNRQFIDQWQVGWLCQVTASSIAEAIAEISRSADLDTLSQHCYQVGASELSWNSGFDQVLDRLGMDANDE